MIQIRAAILAMVKYRRRFISSSQNQKKKYEGITPGYLSFSMVVSLAITIICFFFILREFEIRVGHQKKLEKSVEELNQRNGYINAKRRGNGGQPLICICL